MYEWLSALRTSGIAESRDVSAAGERSASSGGVDCANEVAETRRIATASSTGRMVRERKHAVGRRLIEIVDDNQVELSDAHDA
jgi:hypothetical protein